MTNRKNALPPNPPEPSLFDPPDLDDLAKVSLHAEEKNDANTSTANAQASRSSDTALSSSVASPSATAASAGATTPSAPRRRKKAAKSPDPDKPTTPAAAMRPAANGSAAKARRKKRHWRSSLETDIKTEALVRFQKGEDIETVARALMLPKSAVTSWYEEYQRGILLASERTLAKAEEPTLF